MGIVNPPAESIAAVDPAAVETLSPLDLQFIKEEDVPLFLILISNNTRVSTRTMLVVVTH